MSSPYRLRFGIDVGGTKIALSLVGPGGQPTASQRFPTPRPADPEALTARLVEELRSLLARAEGGVTEIELVGLAFPADFDVATGIALTAPNLPLFVGLDPRRLLAEALEEKLGYGGPVLVGNDASAAALAEGRWGAGRGLEDFLYLTISTGIGGARYRRHGERASATNIEPGKNTYPDPGRPDDCLDSLASGAALARRVRAELQAIYQEGGAAALAERTDLFRDSGCALSPEQAVRHLETLSARDLGRAAAGDPYSRRWLEGSADLVAASLAQLLAADPPGDRRLRKIIAGGSIALKVPGYLERLREALGKSLLADRPLESGLAGSPQEPAGGAFLPSRDLLPAALGDDRGSLGATLFGEASVT